MRKGLENKPVAGRFAYSYTRWSTPEQTGNSSKGRQQNPAREWCKAEGVALVREYLDDGLSGYHGDHLTRDPDAGGLAAFLRDLRQGDIPRGSFLVAENADRLSRMGTLPSLAMVGEIIKAGVSIVLLQPAPVRIYDSSTGDMAVMMLALEFGRAHGESERKSGIHNDNWSDRRAAVKGGSKLPLPGNYPFWLSPVWFNEKHTDGEYQPNDGAEAVRLVFELAADGWGPIRIAKELRRRGVQPLPPRRDSDGYMGSSYISRVLVNPAVYGRLDAADRDDYYPPVVSRDEFFRVQAVMASRAVGGRSRQREAVRLVSGLLEHIETGSRYMVARSRGRYDYVPLSSREVGPNDPPPPASPKPERKKPGPKARASVKVPTEYIGFPVHAIEKAVLQVVKELTPSVLSGTDDGAKLAALVAERDGVVNQIAAVSAALEKRGTKVEAAIEALGRLEARQRVLAQDIAQERARLASPIAETLAEAQALAGLDMNDEPTRLKVQSALRRLIRRIRVAFRVRAPLWRCAYLRVEFRQTSYFREAVCIYRKNLAGHVPEVIYIDDSWVISPEGLADPDDAWEVLDEIIDRMEAEEVEVRRERRTAHARARYAALTDEQKAERVRLNREREQKRRR